MPIDPDAQGTEATRPGLTLATAASIQDDLLVVTHDLERLQQLLGNTCQELLSRFNETRDRLLPLATTSQAPTDPAQASQIAQSALEALGNAVLTLQFEDMCNQLVNHTSRRLRNCADRLARDAMGDDEDGIGLVEDAPLRPNPVTQDEMDAGSIELF